jgi:hypothetical protein
MVVVVVVIEAEAVAVAMVVVAAVAGDVVGLSGVVQQAQLPEVSELS